MSKKLVVLVFAVVAALCILYAIVDIYFMPAIASYQNEEYLYFARYHLESDVGIMCVRQDGSGLKCVFDGKWQSFKVFRGKLYVLTVEGLYRMEPEGSSKKLILPRTSVPRTVPG
jgi:hypothetical protein